MNYILSDNHLVVLQAILRELILARDPDASFGYLQDDREPSDKDES